MEHITPICPQCGAPLPRQALWRSVVCTYCSAEVTRSEPMVSAARFRDAYLRSIDINGAAPTVFCEGHHYRVILRIATGCNATLSLAERVGALTERVILKVAHASAAPGRLKQEKDILDALQADPSADGAYFSQRLPQVVGFGAASLAAGRTGDTLLLRHPVGFWGSLAEVRNNYLNGIDPRHAVWMWRRTLDLLAYVHGCGWVHGNVQPGHLLVQPPDHGILIIGWAQARQLRGPASTTADAAMLRARDLMQSAWSMRMLLSGGDPASEPGIPSSTPQPLATLLRRASEDLAWCATLGAQGLDAQLVAAAHASFGPPKFVDFTPNPQS
jgi:hypothetical protein